MKKVLYGVIFSFFLATLAHAATQNGSNNVAAAGLLTGNTLNSGVVNSSITLLGSGASLPGSPTTTTQLGSDSSTKIATTAQVQAAIAASPSSPFTATNTLIDVPKYNLYIRPDGILPTPASAQTDNIAIGDNALGGLTTGNSNVAYGEEALQRTSTGSANTGIGYAAGMVNQTGSNNTIIGFSSDTFGTGDNNEIILGSGITGAGSNTATIGNSSIANVYFGNGSAILHGNGSALTGISATTSLAGLTTNVLFDANGNINLGLATAEPGSAIDNTFVGNTAGHPAGHTSATTQNTGVGYHAFNALTSGDSNTAVGYIALAALTTGQNNIAIGSNALNSLTTTANNTAIGTNSQMNLVNGIQNTSVGENSLHNISSNASYNTAIGFDAGSNLGASGTYNTLLGNTALGSGGSATNQIVIGYGTTGVADNTALIGNSTTTDAYFGSSGGNTNIRAATHISLGTKFTISGCSAGTTIGGASAGSFVSGTSGTCTVTITMNGATGSTAPHGWSCWSNNETTALDQMHESGSNATTVTLTGTTVMSDVIDFGCMGY